MCFQPIMRFRKKVMIIYREERRKTKRCISRRKREVNEQFGKKMNEDIQGNKKLFWKEVRKVGKESNGNLSNIMNGNGSLVTD